MSNVLFIFDAPVDSKNKILSYYDQFGSAFKNMNHNVLMVHKSAISVKENDIINFKPDLILSYNHVINEYIYKNTNCPVIAFEADTVDVFCEKHLIKKYQDRFYLGIAHSNRVGIIKQKYPWLKDERIIVIKNSTILETENLYQDINISCISTLVGNRQNNPVVQNIIKNIKNIEYIDRFKIIFNKALYDWNDIGDDDLKFLGCSYLDFFHYMSFYTRLTTLDNIASLGLQVYGSFHSLDSIVNLCDLFLSLKSDSIYSLTENQNLYNRSKLSVNVHFIHNPKHPNSSVYSWRVCNIMATNACLVSTKCPALDQDFGKWVKIPQFSNKNEAYEICKKLLSEENLRKDVVDASNLAIKEGKFSFYERVKELEQIFNLKSNENNDELIYKFLIKSEHRLTSIIYRKLKQIMSMIYNLSLKGIVQKIKKITK
jgi:hypothetical protein